MACKDCGEPCQGARCAICQSIHERGGAAGEDATRVGAGMDEIEEDRPAPDPRTDGGVSEAKKANDDWSVRQTDVAAGDIEADIEIRGNEYQGEQFWIKFQNLVQQHEEAFGEGGDSDE